MNGTCRVLRQASTHDKGRMVAYGVEDISSDMSFLEVLDVLNERLTLADEDPIAFDHDRREGICGACGVVINGIAHGPESATPTCQLPRPPLTAASAPHLPPRPFRPIPRLPNLR